MKTNTVLILILVTFCISYEKHLDEKIYTSKDITVKWYKVSDLSNTHDFIDLERWGNSTNIMKANTDGIYDIKILGDTIFIRTLPNLIIYDLVEKKNDCYIKLDSSVTEYEYMKKFQPKNAKYFLNK